MKNLLVGLLALALLTPMYMGITTPAQAQSSCAWYLDDVTPALTEPFIVIDEPDAVKALVEMLVSKGQFPADIGAKVTRVLLAKITGEDAVQRGYYGLEIDGCLTGVDAEATAKDLDTFLAKADQDFERASKAAPDNGEAWADRGTVHTLHEDYATAEQYLSTALQNPTRLRDPALTRANLAWALFHQKKYVEAAKELRTVLQFKPKMCVATYRLGRVYFAREEWEKAAESFQTVSEDPSCGSQEASYYLMKTRMQQGLGNDAKTALVACVKFADKSCIAMKCRAEGPQ